MEEQDSFWNRREFRQDATMAGLLGLALCFVMLYDWIFDPPSPIGRTVADEIAMIKQAAELGKAVASIDTKSLAEGGLEGLDGLDGVDASTEIEKIKSLAKAAGLEGLEGLDALDNLNPARPEITPPPPPELPPLNTKVLGFAQFHLGNKVGNGECWTLANEALIHSDAEPADAYVFGKEVPLTNVLPGDVLQFYEATFKGPMYEMAAGAPHHTAIVTGKNGSRVDILHQNVNDDRTVQKGWMDFSHMTGGTVRAYRPIAKK